MISTCVHTADSGHGFFQYLFISYRFQEGWLYLAIVIDLFNRKLVGFAMAQRMTRALVIDALRMAWFRRQPTADLIFHSDRGSQYVSKNFAKLLANLNMQASMSRKSDC